MARLIDEGSITDPVYRKKIPDTGKTFFMESYVEIPHTGIGKFDYDAAVEKYGEASIKALEDFGFMHLDRERGLYLIPAYLKANTKNVGQKSIEDKYAVCLDDFKDSPLAGLLYKWLRKRCSDKKNQHVFEVLESFANQYPSHVKAWESAPTGTVAPRQETPKPSQGLSDDLKEALRIAGHRI